MKAILALLLIALSTVAAGCGSDAPASSSADQTQGTSTCGSEGFVFNLHGVDCELVNAMIVLLDGRSRHQTLTLSGEHGKATWVCKSASIVGPMECRNGARFFKVKKD
jgi:hypothetical protein